MAQAVLCPVCGGSGKYTEKCIIVPDTSINATVTCHGCNGRGWVEIGSTDYYPWGLPWYPPIPTAPPVQPWAVYSTGGCCPNNCECEVERE